MHVKTEAPCPVTTHSKLPHCAAKYSKPHGW